MAGDEWRAWLPTLGVELELNDPAPWLALKGAEEELGLEFPDQLRTLLLTSDGVHGPHGLRLVWNVADIVAENKRIRVDPSFRSYMPFDSLLLFSDGGGNGDRYAFPIRADGTIGRGDVFLWDHEDDSRTWAAASLKEWFAIMGRAR